MDPNHFDQISKRLAAGTSRRTLVKGLSGGILAGALALVGRGQAGAKPARVGICHHTGNVNIPVVYQEVSASTASVLLARGDTLPGSVTDCSFCGDACSAPEHATAYCGGSGCGFTCDAGYQLDEAGDACLPVSLCSEGYAEVNGGCFRAVGDIWDCPPLGCSGYGSIQGTGSYVCGSVVAGTYCPSWSNDECPDGTACYAYGSYCIAPCG